MEQQRGLGGVKKKKGEKELLYDRERDRAQVLEEKKENVSAHVCQMIQIIL